MRRGCGCRWWCRGDGGEDGELVDELGGEGAGDVDAAEAAGGAVDLNGAEEFAVVLFYVEDGDFSAQGGDDVEQGGAGGVHAEAVEDEVGIFKEEGGAEKEGGGREVAGTVRLGMAVRV